MIYILFYMKYRCCFSQFFKNLPMKFSAILCLPVIFACGCNHDNLQTKLLSEQKLLKDSAFHISERIGDYLQKGQTNSATAEKLQLGAVHARLTAIQASIDSLANVKK